jgi:hypothetical protein
MLTSLFTFQNFVALATVLGAIATAVATFYLYRVTKLLAIETKKMADASAQPQVVANIAFNQWAMNHCDLSVTNTGNATAFDILVEFDPPLEVDDEGLPRPETPLHRISLLKPGQSLSNLSYS